MLCWLLKRRPLVQLPTDAELETELAEHLIKDSV
nr:MAG TPA: hypothetical protein [Caudoviricetes sp.]